MNLNRFRVGTRLGAAFALILAITVLIAVVGVWRLGSLAATSHDLATTKLERATVTQAWTNDIRLNWVRTAAALTTQDAAQIAKLRADMDATSATTSAKLKRLEELLEGGGADLLGSVAAPREAYRSARSALMKRKDAGEDVSAAVERDLRPLADTYTASLDALLKHMDRELAESQAQAAQAASTGQAILVGGTVLAIVLGVLTAWLVTRSITGPVQQAVASATAMADGDLAARIPVEGRDETARLLQALAHMQQRFGGIVSGVRRNAEGVATASAEIASGNADLSARTEQQASALEETAASMEELSSTVKQNADNARQANQLALGASTVAVRGGEVVGQVVETMKGINDSSKQIADIIGTIDGIAFQTNILALNAAVEAARAGEQGRGFAVVAGEVRSLAQRSAEAAKQIKTLISTSVERVEHGTALVDQAGSTMQEVVASIRRVADIVGEISSASTEQSAGVSQVGEAVTQMDQATQQNAALVEQSAAAAESLKTQANQLVEAVAVFRLEAGAAAAPAAPVAWNGSERRGPGRATNVSRLVPKPALHAARPAAAPARSATGTDDWTRF
ncbi:methyl-accepting chemotaxis protein [Aquincola sp. MAHUQ-54]|uniref:Methyl-accepting chemotaxis protein n=1 Tax=Aquincola agrisoli TaxID=3119538 RepID=A0AAW9QHA2_9BURK